MTSTVTINHTTGTICLLYTSLWSLSVRPTLLYSLKAFINSVTDWVLKYHICASGYLHSTECVWNIRSGCVMTKTKYVSDDLSIIVYLKNLLVQMTECLLHKPKLNRLIFNYFCCEIKVCVLYYHTGQILWLVLEIMLLMKCLYVFIIGQRRCV